MNISEIEYMIVTRYYIVLVTLENTFSSTFFTLRGSHFGHTKNNGVIGIGFVNGDHLVQVKFLT